MIYGARPFYAHMCINKNRGQNTKNIVYKTGVQMKNAKAMRRFQNTDSRKW